MKFNISLTAEKCHKNSFNTNQWSALAYIAFPEDRRPIHGKL